MSPFPPLGMEERLTLTLMESRLTLMPDQTDETKVADAPVVDVPDTPDPEREPVRYPSTMYVGADSLMDGLFALGLQGAESWAVWDNSDPCDTFDTAAEAIADYRGHMWVPQFVAVLMPTLDPYGPGGSPEHYIIAEKSLEALSSMVEQAIGEEEMIPVGAVDLQRAERLWLSITPKEDGGSPLVWVQRRKPMIAEGYEYELASQCYDDDLPSVEAENEWVAAAQVWYDVAQNTLQMLLASKPRLDHRISRARAELREAGWQLDDQLERKKGHDEVRELIANPVPEPPEPTNLRVV